MKVLLAAAWILTGLSGAAFACDIRASAEFLEGAPRDRLVVRNLSAGEWTLARADWLLARSKGRVLFDTTASGAGVQVYQPFRIEKSEELLARQPEVTDGDQALTLEFKGFGPGRIFIFSIDVDDQLQANETIVDGTEMKGAEMVFGFVGPDGTTARLRGTFEASADTIVASGCVS